MSQKDPGDRPPKGTADAALEPEIYAKRKKIYPRAVTGVFRNLRVLGVLTLLGIYYIFPLLRWDDRQAVLLDLPARKFYIFGWVFWPQDFFYLAVLLILAALALFFFTTLAGRLWCGYACPQTVWTEVFIWMERWVEGSRNQQMKRDQAGWSLEKLRTKGLKHTLWVVFSLYTGFTFVGYFTPIDVLWNSVLSLSLGPWETFWILFYSFATWGNAGFMREQVCVYMCPYARFQSAMFDSNTLIIAYDEQRGEPRGTRKRKVDPKQAGLGDCVDCTLCVQVCPTGIDIRDGLQYQCIGCAACIDVCDDVMDKMGYAKGLIRYSTEQAMHGETTHVLRPRTVVYGALLLSIFLALLYAISQRIPIELDVIRDRNTLYRETNEGLVENVYTLKLINMDEQPHEYRLAISGLEGAVIEGVDPVLKVAAGAVVDLPVRVVVDPVNLPRPSNQIQFTVESIDTPELRVEQSARYLGPVVR